MPKFTKHKYLMGKVIQRQKKQKKNVCIFVVMFPIKSRKSSRLAGNVRIIYLLSSQKSSNYCQLNQLIHIDPLFLVLLLKTEVIDLVLSVKILFCFLFRRYGGQL